MRTSRFDDYNHRVNGLSLIAGPLVLLTSSISFLMAGDMDRDDVGGVLQILAFFFLIFAVLGLTEMLAKNQPRAAIVFRVLLVFGCVYGCINGLSSVLADGTGFGISSLPDRLAALLVFPGILFPLTLGVLGVVLWRTGSVPALVGAALAVGGFLFPVGRIPDIAVLYVITDVLLILSMGWIGINTLRGRMPEHD